MNALIAVIEGLSGSVLPWIVLLIALVGFGFGLYSNYKQSSKYTSTMNRSRDNLQSDAMHSMTNLKSEWAARRNYDDTLKIGPIMSGPFVGWFKEETDLCESFQTAKKKLQAENAARLKEHPRRYERYLEIVKERERKPHSALIYAGLLLLMGVEATGFSLIFADRLTDTASAQAVQQYAILIAAVIAMFALFFADRVGRALYRQQYAHLAHVHAPGGGIDRSESRALGIDDEDMDSNEPQSTRIINRSDFVYSAAAASKLKNSITPKYPIRLWYYIAGVVCFGLMVGIVRIGQIDEFYAKEASSAMTAEAAEPSEAIQSKNIPPGVVQSKANSAEAVTQEALEKERTGKQLAIGVFIMIFFLAQTLGVVIAAARGFASNEGEKAYKAIEDFKRQYGDLTIEQFQEKLLNETANADRYAQEALSGWQVGLQTAYTSKHFRTPNEPYFAQCVGNFAARTYEAHQQLKLRADEINTQYAQAYAPPPPPDYVPQQHRGTMGPALQPSATARAPTAPMPGYWANGSQVSATPTPIPSAGPALGSPLVEFFISTPGGDEAIERLELSALKEMLLQGKVPNAALLNVRLAGQPGAFCTWLEFAKRGYQ